MAKQPQQTVPIDEHPLMSVFTASFHSEWDGTIEVPYLDSLIKPDEHLHIKHIPPLAVDTPYGNLTSSWMTLLCDISAINELIQKTNNDHAALRDHLKNPSQVAPDQGLFTRQRINAENLSQLLKTLADRFIMLLALIDYERTNGIYPEKIHIDSIGGFLAAPEETFCRGKLDCYRVILKRLNTIANAQKHTFLNLQSSSIIMQNTPGVLVFYQHRNDTSQGQTMEYLIFVNVIRDINAFVLDVKKLL